MSFPNKRDCTHGSKRGSCNLCDYEQEVKELEAENSMLRLRMAELEKEIVTSSKNNIATEILNIMEREKVENFSIDVFKTDGGIGRDLQITCEYLDGKSVADTIRELEKERDVRDLEQQAKGIEDAIEWLVTHYPNACNPSAGLLNYFLGGLNKRIKEQE